MTPRFFFPLTFQFICRQFEMVLGDGSQIWCGPNERPELFLAIPFSYGTCGFLTAVDIDIIPYKPYIKYDVDSTAVFLNLFSFATPFLGDKTICRHPSYNLQTDIKIGNRRLPLNFSKHLG